MDILIKGILLGLSVAAPVGPIGLLCINRTLTYGRMTGFICGLGAATADLIYGIIAGLGLTVIMQFLIAQKSLLNSVGAFFLIYIGIQTIRKYRVEHAAISQSNNLITAYISTLFLTITNPMTILFFLALFTGMNIEVNHQSSLILVSGVFIGSVLWWLTLSQLAYLFHQQLSKYLHIINLISGTVLILLGMKSLVHIFNSVK